MRDIGDYMDLINKVVIHKAFGEGVVTKHNAEGLFIRFGQDERRFSYPDSFESFLQFENTQLQEDVQCILQQKKAQKQQTMAAWHYSAPATQKKSVSEIKPKPKTAKDNIVFKCNYCDGGVNEYHIGYMGPCSEKMIEYNIDVAHHSWCSDADCPCRRFLNGEFDVFELEQMYLEGEMVCYESKMLIDWTAFAGTILRGEKKDEPKKIKNTRLNSLAVLTTRKPYATEADRFVFGVFLVDDADEGDSREAGFVKCTSEYRIELSPKEATQIKFWNYHANDTKPERAVWGQGLYRYTNDLEAAQILRDIAKVKNDPSEKKFAEDFLAHFCKMKGIKVSEIPEPNGALRR